MFRMYTQKPSITVQKTTVVAPIPNIRIRPLASSVVLGSVFAPLYTSTPCTSCGHAK
jgi:hypothetical protein